MSLDDPGQPCTSAWVKGLATKGQPPLEIPLGSAHSCGAADGEGGAEAFGGRDIPGEGYTQGGGVQFGKGCLLGERHVPKGRSIPQEEGCLWGGPPFSPGLHGASLAGVHIPDVAGWVNKELKLGQR